MMSSLRDDDPDEFKASGYFFYGHRATMFGMNLVFFGIWILHGLIIVSMFLSIARNVFIDLPAISSSMAYEFSQLFVGLFATCWLIWCSNIYAKRMVTKFISIYIPLFGTLYSFCLFAFLMIIGDGGSALVMAVLWAMTLIIGYSALRFRPWEKGSQQ